MITPEPQTASRPDPPPAPKSPPELRDMAHTAKPGWSRETYISLLAASGILAHLIFRYALGVSPARSSIPLIAVLLLGGAPLLFELGKRVLHGEFGSDFLAGLSIAASAALGEYLAGSIVVLMLSGGTALEHYATRRASSVLGALAKRMPRMAHRKQGSQLLDVDVSGIQIG